MKAEAEQASQAGRWTLWIALAVVAYALGMAPLHACAKKWRVSPKMMDGVIWLYQPLDWAANHSQVANQWVTGYQAWWFRITGVGP